MKPPSHSARAQVHLPIRSCPFLFALLFATSLASGATLDVPANANIFGAGHSVPPAPGGAGEGVLPPSYDLGFTVGSGVQLTFSSVTGSVILNSGSGDNANDPDGVGAGSASTIVNSFGGIGGIIAPNAGFLVGVFEDANEPMNPAPLELNFISIGTSFTSLSPALNQVFFIGDGLTGDGNGALQQFQAPAGATRLFLGIADAPGYDGDPGGYSDNTGQFSATFTVVPEPSSIALIVVGLAAANLGFLIRRR